MLFGGCDARVNMVQPAASTAPPAVLTVAAADTALAQRAGWKPGIPDASVFVRLDGDPRVRSFASGGLGQLSLGEFPAADYWVWVEKHPSGDELASPTLAPPALGDGRRLGLSPGGSPTLYLRGQENGSLVISEFSYEHPPMAVGPDASNYTFHWYIELYNNADTTVYLDGKIVGAGFDYGMDADLWPCPETEPFRNDPRGIWSQRFQAFPGGGHDYPLAAGKTVVIAEQAIDHSAIYPGLPDLRGADFQFSWARWALNPSVPAMLPIQLRTLLSQTMFYGLFAVPFVAEPVDVAALERRQGRYTGGDEALFPKQAILDVAVLYTTQVMNWLPTTGGLCRMMVHESLDALGAFARPSTVYQGDSTHLLSAQRKRLPDGHLQRTGTSAVDWTMGWRSPGRVP
jgi:hypothetical protein